MKAQIYVDEVWPVYFIETFKDNTPYETMEIDNEIFEKYQKVFKEYQEIQEILRKMYGEI